MRAAAAGEEITYVITRLEMRARPGFARPQHFSKAPTALIKAERPPNWYFLSLYDAVGKGYAWQDLHEIGADALTEFVASPHMHIYTFLKSGWLHGFFALDARGLEATGTTDLAYFGLVPEAIGQGLGTYLLQTAILMGWDLPGTTRMTVNTCTLDHPRALALYQKHGFNPIAQETRTRVLTEDWDPAAFP